MSSARFFLILSLAAILTIGPALFSPITAKATEVRRTEPHRDNEPLISPAVKKPTSAVTVGKAAHGNEQPEVLQETLLLFARECIITMNRQRRPGVASKEIVRQPDGSYKARYMAIDPDSLAASFNPTEGNPVIKYIGRMEYHEVEYISIGKDHKQALAGPFNESNRMPVTELIKFKSGKWSY